MNTKMQSLESDLIDEFRDYVIMEPRHFVIDLSKCSGSHLVTVEGRKIFDWVNYYASKLIGHNHARLFEQEYLKRLSYAANNKVSNPDFVTPEIVAYYKLAMQIAPRCMLDSNSSGKFTGKIFTLNSGAEAMENGLKYLVSKWQKNRIRRRPARFLTFEQGFHGRTVFTLGITHTPHNSVVTQDFESFEDVQSQKIPFPEWQPHDMNASNELLQSSLIEIERELSNFDYAGIVVEPMQGAGGHRVAHPEFFQKLSLLSKKYDTPLCFDEVQTGGGPCGTIFLCDQLGLEHPPEVVVSAKKFACGILWMKNAPVESGVLDSTWSGPLVDMVRFVQEMKIVEEENLIGLVADKSEHLRSGLESLARRVPRSIHNVRGYGLYLGFSLCQTGTKSKLIERALAEHSLLIMGAAGDTIRLRPNLSITSNEIDELLRILDKLFS